MSLLAATALLLAGCALLSEAEIARLRDGDGDGVPAWDDCDDADPRIPAPRERFEDADDDGLGGPVSRVACPGVGFVETSTDCDDGDAEIGAPTDWYPDEDRDGAPRADGPTTACEPPGEGWGPGPGADCDDADGAVHPDAAEACENAVDDDCDGLVDECGINAFGVRIRGADGNIGLGSFPSTFADVDDDGIDEVLIGLPYWPRLAAFPGAVGRAPGEYPLDDALWIFGENASYFGIAAAAGDLDGDGVADLAVGSHGQVFVYTGALDPSRPFSAGTIDGEVPDGRFGGSVFRAPGEILIGDTDADGGCGTAWIVPTPLAELDVSILDAGVARFTWDCAGLTLLGRGLGTATAIAVQADGTPAYGFGAIGRDNSTGAAWLWRGEGAEGVVSLDAEATRWVGQEEYSDMGAAMAAGDLDADGHTDFVFTEAFARSSEERADGAAYVLLNIDAETLDTRLPALKIFGEAGDIEGQYSVFGASVAVVPDLDGDGADELVIGAPAWSGDTRADQAGAVYFVRGEPGWDPGAFSASEASARLYGDGVQERVGMTANAGGDVDGDGLGDVAVGVEGWTDADGTHQGSVIVLLGAEL